MQTTTNYGLRKPEYNETVDVADLNYNADEMDAALTPTADPALVYPEPMSNGPHKIEKWVSWIAKLIKSITGKTNWWEVPSKSLETVNNDLSAHLADEMPHQFTSTNKTYRYGFKAQDNHLIFTYEEVV